MDLSKWFVIALILTSLAESLLMVFWLLVIRIRGRRQNIHHAYWMLRGVQLSYFISTAYLLVRCVMAGISGEYSAFAMASPLVQRALQAFFWLWGAGLFCGLLCQLFTYMRFRWMKASATRAPVEYKKILQKTCKKLGLRREIQIYQGYEFESPCIVGIRHPVIYMPIYDFETKELNMIFCHEITHYMQGDTFWKPLFGLVRNFYWFNPLSVKLQKETVRWTEANCDAYCCEKRFRQKKYFTLLFELGCNEKKDTLSDYVPMWRENNNELKWRIQCMKFHEMKKASTRMAIAIAMVSVLCGGASAHAATLGAEQLYTRSVFETVDQTDETVDLTEGNDLVEYEGTAADFEGLTVEQEEEEEGISVASDVKTIDWTVKNNAVKCSAAFTLKKGAEVTVSVGVAPTDKTIQIGIQKPNGDLVYVQGKKMITHTFTASKKGSYRVYAKNTSGTKVSVTGFYMPD